MTIDNYRKKETGRLKESPEYFHRMQIMDHLNNATKWLSITPDEWVKIKRILIGEK